jgi:hypothetical protein
VKQCFERGKVQFFTCICDQEIKAPSDDFFFVLFTKNFFIHLLLKSEWVRERKTFYFTQNSKNCSKKIAKVIFQLFLFLSDSIVLAAKTFFKLDFSSNNAKLFLFQPNFYLWDKVSAYWVLIYCQLWNYIFFLISSMKLEQWIGVKKYDFIEFMWVSVSMDSQHDVLSILLQYSINL